MADHSRTPLYCKEAFAAMDSVTRFCRSQKKKKTKKPGTTSLKKNKNWRYYFEKCLFPFALFSMAWKHYLSAEPPSFHPNTFAKVSCLNPRSGKPKYKLIKTDKIKPNHLHILQRGRIRTGFTFALTREPMHLEL